MSDTVIGALGEIGSGLVSIISGLFSLLAALLIGSCSLIVEALDDGDKTSSCGNTETVVVEQYTEMHRNAEQQDFHEQMLSMTRQKPGVSFNMLRPEMDSVISIVANVYHTAMNDDEFKPLITSANDFEGHAEKSAHYVGAALDFRIKDMGKKVNREKLAQMVREELGNRFIVLHEDIGKENEHLHVQLRNGTYDKSVVWK